MLSESDGPKRILVADDELVIRTLLSEIISQDGHHVTLAEDGAQAIQLLEDQQFDLIITDIVMPNANGVEVIKAAKQIDATFPIIVITAHPSIETVSKVVRLGAADYVIKPFNVDHVQLTVAKVLAMRSQFARFFQAGSSLVHHEGSFSEQIVENETFKALADLEVKRSRYHELDVSLLNVRVQRTYSVGARTGALRARFEEQVLAAVRPGDVVGRTGKEDLTILLPSTRGGLARSVFGRIDQTNGFWTLAHGIVSFPDNDDSADELIRHAQHACRSIAEPAPVARY